MNRKSFNENRIFETVTDGFLFLIGSVFLLFPGTQGYMRISMEKATLFSWIAGAYVGIMLLLMLEVFLLGDRQRKQRRAGICIYGLAELLVFLFWGLTALSAICSPFKKIVFLGGPRRDGLLTISLYCWSFFFVSRYARPREWMLWLFGICVTVNSAIALIQVAGGNPLQLYPAGMTYYDAFVKYNGSFLGTVGNSDMFSAVMCTAIPVFWIGLLKLKSKRRFWLLIPLVFGLAASVVADVDAGVVGLSAAFLLTFPLLFAKRQVRRGMWLLLAVVVVGVFLGVYFLGGKFGGFVYEASEVLHGRVRESFGSGRIYIWKKVLELVPQNLLLGGGPDTLGFRTDASFTSYHEDIAATISMVVDTAHNEYLNILANQGLLALLVYVAALVISFVGWIRIAPQSPVALLCGAAVLGYCAQAFFGISAPEASPYLWVLWGLLIREFREKGKSTEGAFTCKQK